MVLTGKAEPQAESLFQFEQVGRGHTAKASGYMGAVERKQPPLDRTGKEKTRFLPFL